MNMKRKQKTEHILQQCLEMILSGEETIDLALSRYPNLAEDLHPELEAAVWLHTNRGAVNPRPGFIPATRQWLVAQVGQESLSKFPIIWHSPVFRFATVVFLVLSFLFTSSGAALASVDALPGDDLYPVKTLLEDAHLAFTLDTSRDAELRIQFAQRYLVECAILVSAERFDDALIALQNYDRHIVGISRIVRSLDGQIKSGDLLLADFSKMLMQDATIFHFLLSEIF